MFRLVTSIGEKSVFADPLSIWVLWVFGTDGSRIISFDGVNTCILTLRSLATCQVALELRLLRSTLVTRFLATVNLSDSRLGPASPSRVPG